MAELGQPGTLRFVRLAGEAAEVTAGGGTPAPGGRPGTRPEPARAASAAPAGKPAKPVAAAPTPAKPAPLKLDPAEFKEDPLIAEALEIFRGQLVEVRPEGEARPAL